MNRVVPFDTSEFCQVCNVKGCYDFQGDYLCEKCFREDQEAEYDDEFPYLDIEEDICPCTECKCGKQINDSHSWLI